MKKRVILATALLSIISMAAVTACGSNAATEEAEGNVSSNETVDSSETDEEEATEETSFGLQDYEGFYCMTTTEEIEGYNVTSTHGYLFNGDGTGMAFGQDVIDITWNETEIHFGEYTENFQMEPGKLTVGDLVFDKIEGKFIAPNPVYVDINNIDNGIYAAYIDKDGISETDAGLTIRAELYTEESYDIVDINRMAKGDVLYIKGQLIAIDSVEETAAGYKVVNGGLEEGGCALRPVDESNCYVYLGMDMEKSYTCHGFANLAVSDSIKLIDDYDPSEEKEYTGTEAINKLKEIVEEYPLYCHDCSIMVEDGAIIEVKRWYVP